MQLAGRLVFTPITARLGHRWATASILLIQAAAIGQLPLLPSLPTVAPIVVLLGVANGMSTLARATTVAAIFGPRHYASIGGALAVGTTTARALGPVGASLLQVALGGYEGVFWFLTVALVGAGVAVAGTEARGHPPEAAERRRRP
jgi:MFS family permease